MEMVCTLACVVVGTVFLIVALLGSWHYFVTMGVCYAAAVLVSEDKTEDE